MIARTRAANLALGGTPARIQCADSIATPAIVEDIIPFMNEAQTHTPQGGVGGRNWNTMCSRNFTSTPATVLSIAPNKPAVPTAESCRVNGSIDSGLPAREMGIAMRESIERKLNARTSIRTRVAGGLYGRSFTTSAHASRKMADMKPTKAMRIGRLLTPH